MNVQTLSVGSAYPNKLLVSEGALAEFLRSENTLIIIIPNINNSELKAFKKGVLKCGLLAKNGAILFLWQFCDQKGRPVLTLDSPFNARIIPDINLHNITTNQTRLVVNVHVVDSSNNIIKALRAVTMPPDLTLHFLSEVQDQLTTKNNGEEQINSWLMRQPQQLFEQSKQYIMGL